MPTDTAGHALTVHDHPRPTPPADGRCEQLTLPLTQPACRPVTLNGHEVWVSPGVRGIGHHHEGGEA